MIDSTVSLAEPPRAPGQTPSRDVLVVYGTRPEAIKMAPIVHALDGSPLFRPRVAVTGQHRSMLDQVNDVFGITPEVDLDVHEPGQSLHSITSKVLTRLRAVLRDSAPDAVLVQGDTTTAMAAALAAFYQKVPVVHVEAGLRTNDRYSPYPEELNRRLITQLATLHLAPTATSRANLLAENVDEASVVVTGNTVIDALLWTVGRDEHDRDDVQGHWHPDTDVVLVTAHRRESWGAPMELVCRAIADVARSRPQVHFVFPMHRNPLVREVAMPALGDLDNVHLIEPLPYARFVRLLARATIVLTDSGGIQEEAPSLGKPVLVLRETTERPEAVAAGTVRLVGTDPATIVRQVRRLLDEPQVRAVMARAVNPYGDGRAAERSVAAIGHYFGLTSAAVEFTPETTPIEVRDRQLGAPLVND